MDITVRVEVQYVAPRHNRVRDVLQLFRTPSWVRFMVRYISPHLRNAAPADQSVLDSLFQWTTPTASSNACVICMTDDASQAPTESLVRLPCSHTFHHHCIESWLKLRSTCPTCRHQFRKAFSGSYAVRTLNSALVLLPEHRALTKDEILDSNVGGQTVRAVVHVTLNQLPPDATQQQYPCVLNALMMHPPTSTSDAVPKSVAEREEASRSRGRVRGRSEDMEQGRSSQRRRIEPIEDNRV